MDIYFKGDRIMGKLREQMQMDLQLRGITPRTQATYLREVRNLALYFKKSPEELGERELKEYLLYLINDKKLPEGTYRNYYSGLKFLYKHTLKREWVMEKILCPKRRQKLPLVLDLSEVEALFSVTKNLKHKAILMITYSSGLRVSEAARLKVDDIDSKRMMVRIQNGKKGKDRYSILSQTALECLRQYWIKYRPKEWLFEGQKKERPLSTSSIRYIFYAAKKRAGSENQPVSIPSGTALLPILLRPEPACTMSNCFWGTDPRQRPPSISMSAAITWPRSPVHWMYA